MNTTLRVTTSYWRPKTTGSHLLLPPRNLGRLRIMGLNQQPVREQRRLPRRRGSRLVHPKAPASPRRMLLLQKRRSLQKQRSLRSNRSLRKSRLNHLWNKDLTHQSQRKSVPRLTLPISLRLSDKGKARKRDRKDGEAEDLTRVAFLPVAKPQPQRNRDTEVRGGGGLIPFLRGIWARMSSFLEAVHSNLSRSA